MIDRVAVSVWGVNGVEVATGPGRPQG